jgi:hypothetical protein
MNSRDSVARVANDHAPASCRQPYSEDEASLARDGVGICACQEEEPLHPVDPCTCDSRFQWTSKCYLGGVAQLLPRLLLSWSESTHMCTTLLTMLRFP